MTGLIDTNIFLDFVLKREKFYQTSLQVIQTFKKPNRRPFVALHTLSNLYYILSSERSSNEAVECIEEIVAWTQIPNTSTSTAVRALSLGLKDFEDALQLACAEDCDAECVVTRNVSDYLGTDSEIKILSPEEFIGEL